MSFSFYTVAAEYCDFLRNFDPIIPYNMEQKSNRPFIGIVFYVNDFHYYAPLSSPKPKHLHMKNQVDFLKIKNGEWGAINFNNMIPVSMECLTKVEMNVKITDSKADIDYKNLLSNQLSWCNSNREKILKQADKLYHLITSGKARESLSVRCCKFTLLEQQCTEYQFKK